MTSKEKQVEQLTTYMANFVSHIGKVLPDDIIAKLDELAEKEDSPLSKVIYETTKKNQVLAKTLNRPSCQDTGVLQFWVKCGTSFPLIGELDPSGKTSVPILFPRFFSCHYPSGFSVQPAGESEQRHFRRNINYRIGHQPFAVHLQTSSPYCEASFTVHRKEHIAYSSFLPRLYRTVQTLSAFLFVRPDRDMLSLYRHSHHSVR